MKVTESPYLSDVLTQPQALQLALSRFNPDPLKQLAGDLAGSRFDRIILTGMGASFYSLYPTWLYLSRSGMPVLWVDTAELLHYARGQITRDSLVWIVSQSGRSAEILTLLDRLANIQPAGVIGTTNDLSSPLAGAVERGIGSSILLPIDADPETTISTRTYMNSLAICQLAARLLCAADLSPAQEALQVTAQAMEVYLQGWETHLQEIAAQVGKPGKLVLLGRGSSLASVYCGALVIGEAGGGLALGMPAGQFRHGPLEMCSPDLTVILFAGEPATRDLNQRLAATLKSCGARVYWVGSEVESLPTLPMPLVGGIGRPLAEMLPIQLLTIFLAEQAGVVPGQFRHIGKVTLVE